MDYNPRQWGCVVHFNYQGGMEMRIIESELRKRKAELDKLIRTLEKTLSEAPAGKLRTVTDNGRTRYYIRSVPSDRSGKYVSRDNMAKAEAIAQRDYDYLLKKAAEQERSAIDVLLKTWESGTIEVVCDSLALPRQKLIMPRAMSDADYAEYWRSTYHTSLKNLKKESPYTFRLEVPEYAPSLKLCLLIFSTVIPSLRNMSAR